MDSEPFTTMALPAKMEVMMGEIRLWNYIHQFPSHNQKRGVSLRGSCTMLAVILGREREHLLPTDKRRHNTQWLPNYFIPLVHHQEVGRASLGAQTLLAMINGPFQFLDRDKYLP